MSTTSVEATETIAGPTGGSLSGRRHDEGVPMGTVLGRYVVLARVGAGGMGIVYSAMDPELDRKLAVKLLRGRSGRSAELTRARLLHEAKALAKLAHPNVVAIHDVGTFDDRVWLAMEFIDGQTLKEWMRDRERSWRDVLAVMIAAGRGLVAAHEAGLVHRDIKPENVMVSGDGRVRVTDFGLAHAKDAEDDPRNTGASGLGNDAATVDLGMAGTPAYMAPEQFGGIAHGPAIDQFSFCVTMWEAIHGERPFAGQTAHEIAMAVLDRRFRTTTKRGSIPRWLRRVLVRGLAHDPQDRYPSMAGLLHSLERGRARGRIVRVAAAATLVLAIPAAILAVRAHDERRRIAHCEELGARIHDLWPGVDAATSDRISASLRGDGTTPPIEDRFVPWLDASAASWAAAREQSCLAHEIEGRWDDDMRARADACLDDQRIRLEALLQELERADPLVLYRAVTLAAGLPLADRCTDEFELSRMPTPESGAADTIRLLRALDSRMATLQAKADYAAGLHVGRHRLAIADAAGLAVERADARRALAKELDIGGQYGEAEAMLVQAYVEAGKLGAHEVAARTANQLVWVVGHREARRAEALVWAHAAEVETAAVEQQPGLLTAERLRTLSQVQSDLGEAAGAKASAEEALRVLEESLGPEHPRVVQAMGDLGAIEYRAGDYAAAEEMFLRLIPLSAAVLGTQHPEHGTSLTSLGNVYVDTGRAREAAPLYERALAIMERAYGPRHPHVAALLLNLTNARSHMGDDRDARPDYQRMLEIQEAALGADHPTLARTRTNFGAWLMDRGEWADARRELTRAVEILEAAGTGDASDLVVPAINLAVVHRHFDEPVAAQELLEHALQRLDHSDQPEHPVRSSVLVGLGDALLAQRRWAEAADRYGEAVRLLAGTQHARDRLARARFGLAQALHPSDRTRSLASARQAREDAAAAGDDATVVAIDRWLAAH